jgi:small subunit ribosomal protein S13
MPRIACVDIPNDKPPCIALTYIHGIGRKTAADILDACGIDGSVRAKNLSEEEITRIAGEIDRAHMVEGQLRRQVGQNVQRLKAIACYRGIRHRRSLPVRGQRTRTNARTRKGPRRTVANKRGVKEQR